MGERAIVYLDDVIAKVEYHVNRDVRAPLIEALEALPSPPAGGVSRAESATVRVADVLRAALDVLGDEDYARLAARIDAIPTSTPATPTGADLCALADEVAGLRETLTRIGIQRIAAPGPDAEGLEARRLVAMARLRELLGGVATTPPDPTTILARARDIAARVYDLNLLDATHPGLTSQEDVREERGRLIAEIGRLLDGREWARGEGSK